MLYPIEIEKPFGKRYGNKIPFRLPQEIEKIKSLSISIIDIDGLINKISGLPVEIKFDLFKLSILLNNANDQVIVDAPTQLSIFQNNLDWRGNPYLYKNYLYKDQRIILNKKIIKNAVHYAVFKMTDDLLAYIKINTYTKQFGDYLRSNNFKLILYVEA